MNYLKISVLCTALCLCLYAPAQNNRIAPLSESGYNKPKLFNDLPERIQLPVINLEQLIDEPVGSTIKTRIGDHFIFEGTVVSKSNDPDVKSVVIRSSNRQGATLTFTKVHRPDGRFSYIGRIISLEHSDAYEIVQQNGEYILQKRDLNDLVSE